MAMSVADVIEQLNASLESDCGGEDVIESSQEPDAEAQMPIREPDHEFDKIPDLHSEGSEVEYSDESLSDSPDLNEPSSQKMEELFSKSSDDSQSEQYSDDDSCNEELSRKRGTRKRVRQPDKWKKSKRKRRRNSGQRYISTAKKVVPPKHPSNTPCGCKRQCFSHISDDKRKALFEGFWNCASFDVQNAYLCGCIRVTPTKQKYGSKDNESRRLFTRQYCVPVGQESVQVCKKAFNTIFTVSDGRVSRALKAQADAGGAPSTDRRGRHEPKNKTSPERIIFVKEHIESFPKYKSHYSRQDNPHRSYLSPIFSVPKMYNLYKEKCAEKKEEPVSEWMYRKIFNTEYNLSFGRPKNDTCKTCDHLNTQINAQEDLSERDKLKFELQLHQCRADRAYQRLKEDTALSRASPDVDMFTFDLQQSLPTPKISTSIVFYKRQLWTYNFGVHSCSDGKGYMYMWPESIASRGSHEICSSILKYLRSRSSDATHLIVYSDACGGQNRNINVTCLWMYVVYSNDFSYTTVDHKFMVSGHSYLPNDRDFGSIEKANRRTQSVYVPNEWCSLVETARSKNPFTVSQMYQDDFVTLAAIRLEIVYRKVNILKEKVEWLHIRWIRITKDKPFKIQYKYSHNDLESWKILDVRRKKRGRPSDLGRLKLQALYTHPRPIKENKLKDLMELLNYIPPIHHEFYIKLQSPSTARSDTESDTEPDTKSNSDSDTD